MIENLTKGNLELDDGCSGRWFESLSKLVVKDRNRVIEKRECISL